VSDVAGNALGADYSWSFTTGNLPLEFVTDLLAGVPRGLAHEDSIQATGGVGSYVFSLVGGALPDGMTLSPEGQLEGTATVLGVSDAIIQVTSGPESTTDTFAIAVREFAPVATAFYTTCALTSAWKAYCWGDNVSGGLGDGSAYPSERFTPGPVSGDHTFMQLESGDEHTCGLTPAGKIYCWGFGYVIPEPMGGDMRFLQVVTGKSHTCALSEALETYCWGDNTQGQLGRAGSGSNTPSLVDGGHTFKALAAGRQHTCGIEMSGTMRCWGHNELGQLGDSTIVARSTPLPVRGSEIYSVADGGWDITCGIAASGTWCWGANQHGQLGNGETTYDPTPVPQAVGGGHVFRFVRTSTNRSCAIEDDGEAFCWGINGLDYLGVGDEPEDVVSPTEVLGDRTYIGIDVGSSFGCAMDVGWTLYCWGQNDGGQLGDGTTTSRSQPMAVIFP
jgi:alpha-tubulin suppressor-like RCC1 family protein